MAGLVPASKVIPGTIAAFAVAYVLDWAQVRQHSSSSDHISICGPVKISTGRF